MSSSSPGDVRLMFAASIARANWDSRHWGGVDGIQGHRVYLCPDWKWLLEETSSYQCLIWIWNSLPVPVPQTFEIHSFANPPTKVGFWVAKVTKRLPSSLQASSMAMGRVVPSNSLLELPWTFLNSDQVIATSSRLAVDCLPSCKHRE